MDKTELKRMRKREVTEYLDFKDYASALRGILSDGNSVPVVIGRIECVPSNIEVMAISPMDEKDRLTVLSYCAGVEELSKTSIINTKASIYLGVDGKTKDDSGKCIFSTGFKLDRVSYDLNIFWNTKKDSREIAYNAMQTETTSEAHKLLRKFRGPNFRED